MTTKNHYQYQANYREVNKEKLKLQQADYRKNNPDKVKASQKACLERMKDKEPALTKPDKLIETIRIKLAAEQETFLYDNLEMARPQLFKLFRTEFKSNINKLQFNFALENVASKYRQKLA